jgi:alginate O-acetyltransferase complex protein AlgI
LLDSPGILFNPAIDPVPLSPWELLAGPLGLLAFLPLVPLVRLAARSNPRAALILSGLIWLVATAAPFASGVLLAAVILAALYVHALGRLVAAGRISGRVAVVGVWLGLHAMAFPLWWWPQLLHYGWFGGRMAMLHAIGLSYFLLRLIAWGVDMARGQTGPARPADTLCWLLYPCCMRIGPVMRRQQFLERFDAWRPAAPVPWRIVGYRLGLALVGLALLAIVSRNTPGVAAAAADFFSAPRTYPTRRLLRIFYLIPIQIYLFLWTYNEIAAGLSWWLGIPIDNNFDHLPKATSIRDFWHRWHITVGQWLRDYVYIPLGGNRGLLGLAPALAPLNLFAVFLYCGVWHGASWSFVAWGFSQGLALTVQRGWDGLRERLRWPGPRGRAWTVLCWLLTMHYQLATVLMFADFEHVGTRFFPELLARLISGARQLIG